MKQHLIVLAVELSDTQFAKRIESPLDSLKYPESFETVDYASKHEIMSELLSKGF